MARSPRQSPSAGCRFQAASHRKSREGLPVGACGEDTISQTQLLIVGEYKTARLMFSGRSMSRICTQLS